MRIVNIDIAVSNGLLNSTVKALPKEFSQYTLGTQHDHEAQKFVFTRPEEFAEYDLILHFESGQQPYTVHLGGLNEYKIPNALTQSKELRFQVSFARGDEYLESDAPTTFFLRPKLKDGGEPEPIPSPIDELFDLAVAKFEVDEDRNLLGINNAGRTVSSVYLPGGGGGSDEIWKPTVDENGTWTSARSTSITPPEPRNIMGPKGTDAISPTIDVLTDTEAEYILKITDVEGEIITPNLIGKAGKDAVSPTATVHKDGDTATITITDVNGTTTETISDGTDGNDGYSPSAIVTQTATGARIEITDKDGTTAAEVSNGADGISPNVEVSEIPGGHTITVTDAEGAESFQVMDGSPGQAATIEIGTVTTGEPGTDAVVENVGTDTAAIFNITIPRGKDGSGGGGDLPWCEGVFQNRSVPATTSIALNPTVNSGDTSMVEGNHFIVPSTGKYALCIGGGLVSVSTGELLGLITVDKPWASEVSTNIQVVGYHYRGFYIPSLSIIRHFEAGALLYFNLYATVAQSTINYNGSTQKFSFTKLSEEEDEQ